MNIILNTFDISTEAGAKVLKRCLKRRGFRLSAERAVFVIFLGILAKVVVAQQKEIEELEQESARSKKGD